MIPGLEQVEFLRFGQMHRNTYVRAPALLRDDLSLREHPEIFMAGQLCGVEGYVEAMATGLVAGINAVRRLREETSLTLPSWTALGSICQYLSKADAKDFAPVRFTFDLLPPPDSTTADVRLSRERRRAAQCHRAIDSIRALRDVRNVAAASV